MKLSSLAASLVVVALFAGPGLAQQADQPVGETTRMILPPAVNALLADERPASALTDAELQRRLKQSRQFMKLAGLAPEVKQALRQKAGEAEAELANRQQSGSAGQGGSTGQGEADQGGQPAGQPAAPTQKVMPIGSQIPDDALAYLADKSPADTLAPGALKARIGNGRKLLGLQGLPKDTRTAIAARIESDRAELLKRIEAAPQDSGNPPPAATQQPAQAEQPQPGTGEAPQQTQNAPQPGANGQAGGVQLTIFAQYFQMPRPLAEMSTGELQAKLALGRDILKKPNVPPVMRQRVTSQQQALLAEINRRQDQAGSQSGGQQPGAGGSGQNQPPPQNIDNAAEAQAQNLLTDPRPAQTMGLNGLRQRVTGLRMLLKQNRLSSQTRQAVYQKLVADRTVLRARMAQQEGGLPPLPPGGNGQAGGGNYGNQPPQPPQNAPGLPGGGQINPLDPRLVMQYGNDPRPPDRLDDNELRLRINIYVNVLGSSGYPQIDRYDWQRRLERDREALRMRLLAQRAEREARLRDMNDQIMLDQAPPPMDDPAAAEIDDQEMQDTLTAAPRRKFTRRYSIQDFENSPDLRAAVPRIEIDTIHFGFNESFVREEEIGNLDRVAEVMEKILAAHPDEVFLIEGHTDASGSDSYNLGLSRQRAAAVMQALTTYYVIPAQNLRTVGYGERYLKIPVDGPEPENRRVSVSRITDVIGQY